MNAPAHSVDDVVRYVREASQLGVSCRRPSVCQHLHLDLRPLRQLRFHQPGDLTVGADAGMTVAELDRLLASHGQFVPLDVSRPESTTLGAVLAQHLSGPFRHRFGTVRDFAIGMEMVAADGALVHAGGRVVKNVAGYDWMKLAIGSRGALGIITGVNFKVFPRPAAGFTAVFAPLDWDQVEALRSALLHSPLRPLAIELRATPQQRAVYVRCAGTPAVLDRYRDEFGRMFPAAVEFLAGDAPVWDELAAFPRAGDRSVSFPPAQAVAALRALAPAVEVSGRLAMGVFSIRGAAAFPPAVPTPVAALMRRLKQELDPTGVLHGGDCAG